MKLKNQHQTWEVTLLTPLHIGDGEEMQQNIDFVCRNRFVDVVDMEAVFESLKDNPRAVSEIGRADFNLTKFVRDYKIDLLPLYRMAFSGPKPPNVMRRFIKDGFGRPYMPASSLKGAIRTALQAGFDRSRLPSPSNFQNFKKAVEKLNGSDPHHDFLRPLNLCDSPGIPPEGALDVQEIKFFNLRNGGKPGWKDFGSPGRPTIDQYEKAAGTFVECLKTGVKLHLRATLDRFLAKDAVHRMAELPRCGGLNGFDALVAAINNHSLAIGEAERAFFRQYAPATGYAAAAYDNIVKGIREKTGKAGSEIILRLAWGSGWRGMTGNWLQGAELAEARKYAKPKMGKNGVSVFPKTRRLAMSGNIPCIPLGWVQIRPVSDGAFFRSIVFEDEPQPAVTRQPNSETTAEKKPPASAPDPAPAQKSKTEAQETEQWESVHLKWTPNDDTITATHGDKKATVKGKDLLPQQYHKKMIKHKKAVTATVTVRPYGNAFVIVAIV